MEEKINQISIVYKQKIDQAKNLSDLDLIYIDLFGKNGEMTLLPRQFSKLIKEELKIISPLFNKIKNYLSEQIELKRAQIKEDSYSKLSTETLSINEKINFTLPKAKLHPLTVFERQTADIFKKIGFSQFEAPYIDTDYYNFEALNIPEEHPARDLWDTLYIDSEKYGIQPGKLLLRTHTSNSQLRILKRYNPPIRIMNIGTSFRYENLDARHEHTFDQFELVFVDKNLSLADLQYLSEYYLKEAFGQQMKARLRPKYYPFVEPGAGIDALCIFCKGQGCKICGNTGWIELAGAGMIHPKVLENAGINPKEYSGIAWGIGPERMLMLKYGINDLRLFRNGDLDFLEKLEIEEKR